MGLKEKVDYYLNNFYNWRQNRNINGMKKILNKISITTPELALIDGEGKGLSPAEQIHMYRESKAIKSQILNNWAIVILTIVSVVLAFQTYQLQQSTSPPINPEFSFLNSFDTYPNYQLIGLATGENGTFPYRPIYPYMEINIINHGQRKTGEVGYMLADSKKEFLFNTIAYPSLDALDSGQISFQFEYKNCSMPVEEKDYSLAVKTYCNYQNLETGLRTLYLRINCPACEFNENPQCYQFDICIFNASQSFEWCKKQLENSKKFTPITCPQVI